MHVEVVPGTLSYIRTTHAGENPPRAAFVLSASCLRRRVGNGDIMRAQLERLTEVADLPNVQLQVLPLDTSSYPTGVPSVHLADDWRVEARLCTGVVYVESLDDKEIVRAYPDR